jgi:hypothetical protein
MMALNSAVLASALEGVFGAFPADAESVGSVWTDALEQYTSPFNDPSSFIVPPLAVPGSLEAASAAFEAAFLLVPWYEGQLPFQGLAALVASFDAWAAAAALGMVSGAVTAATPPIPGSLLALLQVPVVGPIDVGKLGADAAATALSWANTLDGWFRTGTFVSGGPAAPWS